MISFSRQRSLYGGLCILLVISGLLTADAPAALAQSNGLTWARAIPVSGALGGSRYPTLVADDTGKVLLFWGVEAEGQATTIFVSRFDGTAWLRPVDVLLGGPRAYAALDGRNRVHLSYLSGESAVLTEAPAEEALSASSWDSVTSLQGTNKSSPGSFAIDSTGSLYAAWMQQVKNCDNCFSVAYEKFASDSSEDSTYRVLSDLTLSPQQRVQLQRGATGTLYAMWDIGARENLKTGIALTVSQNNGAEWLDEPRMFASPDEDIRQPLLWIDNANQLVLVYYYGDKDETYYSVSPDDGTTWSEPQPIPRLFANKAAAATDYFAMATDSAGITHLIASGRASKTQPIPGLYHVAWDGKAWTDFQEIYRGNNLPEFPAITTSNGNRLHVSFATRDPNPVGSTSAATYQVWYTFAQTDAPAATSVPLPTYTPAPTATPTPNATPPPTTRPTSTPFPDVAEDTEGTGTANPFTPILVGVVPGVAILLVVMFWATVMRRRR